MAHYQHTDQDSRNCETWASNIALACIVVGLIMVLMAFLWPISPNFVIDPTLSAKENEELQGNHANMLTTLYTVQAVGMGLLTTGGIISSILLTKVLLQEECFRRSCIPRRQQSNRTEQEGGTSSQPVDGVSGPISKAQHSTYKDTTRLANSDQLESDRDISNAKQYGSFEQR